MRITIGELRQVIREEVVSLAEGMGMESTTLEMRMGICDNKKCPRPGRPDHKVLVVEYYKGNQLTRSRCQACATPAAWRKAADLMAFQGGGVHD